MASSKLSLDATQLDSLALDVAKLNFCDSVYRSESTQLILGFQHVGALCAHSQSSGPPHKLVWKTIANIGKYRAIGTGATKDESKYEALGKLWNIMILSSEVPRDVAWPSVMALVASERKWNVFYVEDTVSAGFRCCVSMCLDHVILKATGFGRSKAAAKLNAAQKLFDFMGLNDYIPYQPSQSLARPHGIFSTMFESVTEVIIHPIETFKRLWRKAMDTFVGVLEFFLDKTGLTAVRKRFDDVCDLVTDSLKNVQTITRVVLTGLITALVCFVLWILGLFSFQRFLSLINTGLKAVGVVIPKEFRFWEEPQNEDLAHPYTNGHWESARVSFIRWCLEDNPQNGYLPMVLAVTRAVQSTPDVQYIDEFTGFIIREYPDKGKAWSTLLLELAPESSEIESAFSNASCAAATCYGEWLKQIREALKGQERPTMVRISAARYHGINIDDLHYAPENKGRAPPPNGPVDNILPFVLGVTGALLTGAWPTDVDSIKRFCLTSSLFTAFTLSSGPLVSMVASCLPVSLKYWIDRLTNPKAFEEEQANDWISRVQPVIACANNTDTNVTRDYRDDVLGLCREGTELITRLTGEPLRRVVPFFNQLSLATKIVLASEVGSRKRPAPYVVWICGPSGLGKTYLTDKLLYRAFGISSKDSYHINSANKHWTGAKTSHKAFIMEEALMAQDREGNTAANWLQLCSTADFIPPMAAVNAKDTHVAPRVIMCTSNFTHPVLEGVDREAVLRRRNIVIKLTMKEGFKKTKQGKPDFVSFTKDESEDFDHIAFRLLDPLCLTKTGVASQYGMTDKMSMRQLVTLLRSQYKLHVEAMTRLNCTYSDNRVKYAAMKKEAGYAVKTNGHSDGEVPDSGKTKDEEEFLPASEQNHETRKKEARLSKSERSSSESSVDSQASGEKKKKTVLKKKGEKKRKKETREEYLNRKRDRFYEVYKGYFGDYPSETSRDVPLHYFPGECCFCGTYTDEKVNVGVLVHVCNLCSPQFKYVIKDSNCVFLTGMGKYLYPVLDNGKILLTWSEDYNWTRGSLNFDEEIRKVMDELVDFNESMKSKQREIEEERRLANLQQIEEMKAREENELRLHHAQAEQERELERLRAEREQLTQERRDLADELERDRKAREDLMSEDQSHIRSLIDTEFGENPSKILEPDVETVGYGSDSADSFHDPIDSDDTRDRGVDYWEVGTDFIVDNLLDLNVKPYEDKTSDLFKSFGKWALIFGGFLALRSLVAKFFGNDKDPYTYHSAPKSYVKTHGVRRMQRAFDYHQKTVADHYATAVIDGQSWPVLMTKKMMVINAHALARYDLQGKTLVASTKNITLKYGSESCHGVVYPENVYLADLSDLAIVDVGNFQTLRVFGDLKKHVLRVSDYDALPATFTVQFGPDEKNTVRAERKESMSVLFPLVGEGAAEFDTKNGVKYKGSYCEGQCGLRVKLISGQHAGRLLGFHSWGDSNGGICTMVFKEELEAVESQIAGDQPLPTNGPPPIKEELEVAPNVKEVKELPFSEKVWLPRKSQIRRSKFDLPWGPKKAQAVLSYDDERCLDEKDPLDRGILKTGCVVLPSLAGHEYAIKKIGREMLDHWTKRIDWEIGRTLTEDEAIVGLPPTIRSLDLSTSSGWPLSRSLKAGKHEAIKVVKARDSRTEEVFELVTKHPFLIEQLRVYDEYLDDPTEENRDELCCRYVAYLKDELRPAEKIRDGSTRVIYCAPLALTIKVRQLMAPFIGAVHGSWKKLSCAAGCNPTSWDMHSLYESMLSQLGIDDPPGQRFVAGDYKGFDQHVRHRFLKEVNWVISELCQKFMVDFDVLKFELLMDLILDTPVAAGGLLVSFEEGERSGQPLTTIHNSMVNELYIRFVWDQLLPMGLFDKNISCKFMGDDHILCLSDEARELLDPLTLKAGLEVLGQEYTSADKVAELTSDLVEFDELSFLGCVPKRYTGSYIGVLKEDITREMLCWTRKNEERLDVAMTALRSIAGHGKSAYNALLDILMKQTWNEHELRELRSYWSWELTLENVARAIAGSHGNTLFMYHGVTDDAGISTLDNPVPVRISRDVIRKTVRARRPEGEPQAAWDVGLKAKVPRAEVEWDSSQAVGTVLFRVEVPHELLSLAVPEECTNRSTIQNFPFEQWNYGRYTPVISLTVNAVMNQCGLLIAYWLPLTQKGGTSYRPADWTPALQHVIVVPQTNAEYTMEIPYLHPRPYLSSFAKNEPDESLGVLEIVVFSQLNTGKAQLVVYSSFKDYEFFSLKPPGISDWEPETAEQPRGGPGHIKNTSRRKEKKYEGTPNRLEFRRVFTQSKMKRGFEAVLPKPVNGNSTSIQVGSISADQTQTAEEGSTLIGDLTTQDLVSGEATQDISPDMELEVPSVMMDKPALAGGAAPVYQQTPSLSKSGGVNPTLAMQLNQVAAKRHVRSTFGTLSDECQLRSLMARPTVVARFRWYVADPTGLLLFESPATVSPMVATSVPYNSGNWSLMEYLSRVGMFWRGRIHYRFLVVGNPFISGRLRFSHVYGAPSAVGFRESSQVPHLMFNIGKEQQVHEAVVDYTTQMEMLRVPTGLAQYDPVQNSTLGHSALYVNTPLTVTDSLVLDSVEVIVESWFDGDIYVPSPCRKLDVQEKPNYISEYFIEPPPVKANGGKTGVDEVESGTSVEGEETADLPAKKETEMSAGPSKPRRQVPKSKPINKLDKGEILEYPIRSLLDLARRYTNVVPNETGRFFTGRTLPLSDEWEYQVFDVFPHSMGPMMAWSGSIHFRINGRVDYTVGYSPMDNPPVAYNLDGDSKTRDKAHMPMAAMCLVDKADMIASETTIGDGWSFVFEKGLMAMEKPYETYGDYQIPYQSQFNFLRRESDDGFQMTLGFFYLVYPADGPVPTVFKASGDDMRFGCFNPTTTAWRLDGYMGRYLESDDGYATELPGETRRFDWKIASRKSK